jgi:DNA primase
MKSVIADYDTKTPEGRVSALNQVAPLIGKIKDASLRPEYVRSVAAWLGMEVDIVSTAVKKSGSRSSAAPTPEVESSINLKDPILMLEREVLKVKLQVPELAAAWSDLEPLAFTYPPYASLRARIDEAPDQAITDLLDRTEDEVIRSLITELTVEPVRTDGEISERYIQSIFARLREVALSREIAEIKSSLQRLNPVENEAEYTETFTRLVGLEAQRRTQKELAIGEAL